MKLQYFKRLVSWILVCGLVAACRSAPTRLFSLTVVPAQKTVAYAGQPIRVDAVSLPATFDRVQIIEQVGPQDYRIDDTSRRAAPTQAWSLPRAPTETLLRTSTTPPAAVTSAPAATRSPL